jgi:putative selenium metabolism hydrolase
MRYDVDDPGLVEFATALARTPSVSTGEQAAVELAASRFRGLGFDRVEIDSTGNAIGVFGSGAQPRLLIDGHIDSIPLHSEARWTVDPFGGTIRDGRLYGLGICDQKGSIAAAAYGVAAARRTGAFAGTVALVASVCEEEIEGAALAGFVEQFDPDFAITSEPSDTRLCIGQRGRCKLEMRVIGRACHAGHASRGLNAAEAIAEAISEIRRVEHPTHRHLGHRDITCIDLMSSPYPSVSTVPGEVVARFDCRFLPGETPESLIGTLQACADRAWSGWSEQPRLLLSVVQADFDTWTGQHLTAPEFEKAWWTEEDSHLVTTSRRALESIELESTPTHYSFCTNGSYLAGERGIPTIGFGVGLEHMAHQVDEYITLDSLRSGAQGYAALAAALTQPPSA